MSRPWVKTYGTILDHPGLGRLSDRTRLIFIEMVVLAGRVDDHGRTGPAEDVAWWLRRPVKQIEKAVAELGGRVAVNDGELWVRDWDDYQSAGPSDSREAVRQRVAAHRARSAPLRAEEQGQRDQGAARREAEEGDEPWGRGCGSYRATAPTAGQGASGRRVAAQLLAGGPGDEAAGAGPDGEAGVTVGEGARSGESPADEGRREREAWQTRAGGVTLSWDIGGGAVTAEREGCTAAVTPCNGAVTARNAAVTPSNGAVTGGVTTGNAAVTAPEVEGEGEQETHNNRTPLTPHRGAGAPLGLDCNSSEGEGSRLDERRSAEVAGPDGEGRWDAFYDQLGASLCVQVYRADGRPYGWAAQLAREAGRHCRDDPDEAAEALWEFESWARRQPYGSGWVWDFVRRGTVADHFGKWVAEHGRNDPYRDVVQS